MDLMSKFNFASNTSRFVGNGTQVLTEYLKTGQTLSSVDKDTVLPISLIPPSGFEGRF